MLMAEASGGAETFVFLILNAFTPFARGSKGFPVTEHLLTSAGTTGGKAAELSMISNIKLWAVWRRFPSASTRFQLHSRCLAATLVRC